MRARQTPLVLVVLAFVGCGLNLLGQGSSPDAGGPPDSTVMQGDAPTAADAGDGAAQPDTTNTMPEAATEAAPDAAPGDAPDDSAPIDAVPPVSGNYVICGSQACIPPAQGCCLPTMTCTDQASCGGTFMACDDRTECTGGSICCVSVHNNGQIRFIACVSSAECQAPPGGNNTGYELCNRDSGEPCALGTMGCGMNATGVAILDPYGTCN